MMHERDFSGTGKEKPQLTILQSPWLVIHILSSWDTPITVFSVPRPLSPPNTGVTCTSLRKPKHEQGWEDQASWILSYLMPQCPQQWQEVTTGEILLSLYSHRECTDRYLQVPSLSPWACHRSEHRVVERRWGSSTALTVLLLRGMHSRGQATSEMLPRHHHQRQLHVLESSSLKSKGPWIKSRAFKTPTAKECQTRKNSFILQKLLQGSSFVPRRRNCRPDLFSWKASMDNI